MFGFNISQAQEDSFVRTYNSVASWDSEDDSWDDWEDIDLVISYNYKGTSKVALFYNNNSHFILFPVGDVTNDTNSSGLNYQTVNYIDSEGEEIILSLFENKVLLLVGDDYILKFNPED